MLTLWLLGEVEEAVKYEKSIEEEMRSEQDSSFLQNIYLFNITADPNERNDLSKVSACGPPY